MNANENDKLLTLPRLSIAIGVGLDRLRDFVPALVREGLLTRVGPSWVIESARAHEVKPVIERAVAERRSHKATTAK